MKLERRVKPRKWRESFTVWIDYLGNRSQIGPLLDHIAGSPSDGGGSVVIGPPLCDQDWNFSAKGKRYSIREAQEDAEIVYTILKNACIKTRFSPYIRLRLLHDDKPDRCTPIEITNETTRAGHKLVRLTHAKGFSRKNARGPLVLRKYQRGKLPAMEAFSRKMPKRKPRRKATA